MDDDDVPPPPPPPVAASAVPVTAAATVDDDEAGAWELLKRRVAENRKLSTENRKLRNDLGEAKVSSTPSRSRSLLGCEIMTCKILRRARASFGAYYGCIESRAGY